MAHILVEELSPLEVAQLSELDVIECADIRCTLLDYVGHFSQCEKCGARCCADHLQAIGAEKFCVDCVPVSCPFCGSHDGVQEDKSFQADFECTACDSWFDHPKKFERRVQ